MKICPNCNTEIEDNAVFCPECGVTLEQNSQESILQSTELSEKETGKKEKKKAKYAGPARTVLSRVASGRLVLFTAILLTVSVLLSFGSVFVKQASLTTAVEDLMETVTEMVESAGIPSVLIPMDEIEAGMGSLENVIELAESPALIITLASQAITLITAFAFWCIWISAKRGKVGRLGFGILRFFRLLYIILLLVLTIGTVIGAIAARTVLTEFSHEYLPMLSDSVLTTAVAAAAAIAVIFLIIAIVIQSLYMKTLKSCKLVCTENYYNGRISGVAAVMMIISGGSGLGGMVALAVLLLMFDPIQAMTVFPEVCIGIAKILCGSAMMKAKFVLADELKNGYEE